MPQPPLIITLTLDPASQQFFNEQRQRYFPPQRNYLDAHLTLFHHLPSNEPQLFTDLELAAATYRQPSLEVTGIKHTGNGVAYTIHCELLMQLHGYLQRQWAAWLIPQDQHKFWPHITIQNKVHPDEAMLLKAQLEQSFTPFAALGTGLSVFEYLGGPWQHVKDVPFTG